MERLVNLVLKKSMFVLMFNDFKMLQGFLGFLKWFLKRNPVLQSFIQKLKKITNLRHFIVK